eukprot:TRINITY_DN3310_c0_g4_i1.p1 TRINITY_DN3310_c0_g4~~TRINITY_DN3310_c0_g4_i1.p1  ORF type:complete len:451 (-),score=165.76 TRINITY_DN3310_c0_g4_i1:55-1374(-)
MNKRIFLLLISFIIFFLLGFIKCQDAGIFEGGDETEDEEFIGSNTMETSQVRSEETKNEKKEDPKKPSTSAPSTTTTTPSSSDDDKLSFMDEEEFDGMEQKTESKEKKDSDNKQPDATPREVNVKPMSIVDFLPEIVTIVIIAIYCAFYFSNRKRNEKKILAWMEKNRDILYDNFTSVKNIVKMSSNEFRVIGTGRLNCVGMELNFTFKREHDLVHTLIDKFYPTQETVSIEIPVGATGTMPSYTLIMMPKSKIANYKKDNSTIAAVTTEVLNDKFPAGHSVLVDTKDLIPLVLSKETRRTLKKFEKYVELVYINDEHHEQPEFPNFIRFIFRLPPKHEDFREILLAVFDTLDRAVSLEMPKTVSQKVSKKRLELQKAKSKYEHEKREERSQQLKDEKKKKLMENKDELSQIELNKLEQREKKKNMKKSNGKMKRVVVG